jgi:hypothetical protein
MNKIFFSQHVLDALTDEGKIKLDGNIITLLTPDKPPFDLEPAYRFIRTSDKGIPDPHGLVGQIKYEKHMKALNAEVYLERHLRRHCLRSRTGLYWREKRAH